MRKTLIVELLDEMERNVRHLEELRIIQREEFIAEPRHHLFAERCFQIAIQCLLDVCMYFAAQQGWERPSDTVQAVLLMGRRGVLRPEFAQRVVGMAKFRNVLVHAYLKVNRGIVYDLLPKLDDFREFARQVLVYMDSAERS